MTNAPSRALDLTAIHPHQPSSMAVAGHAEHPPEDETSVRRPPQPAVAQTEAQRLRAALEDIVALAHSGGTATQRMIQMQRRAIAALAGLDQRP